MDYRQYITIDPKITAPQLIASRDTAPAGVLPPPTHTGPAVRFTSDWPEKTDSRSLTLEAEVTDMDGIQRVVIEVNGRLWGSLQLAIDAGVDFPVLLVKCLLGEDVPAQKLPYRVGVRSRWFWGDLDHLYLRLRYSPAELQLAPPFPTRREALRQFFSFTPRRDRCEVWRWRDPGPFVVETLRWMRLIR